MTMKSKYIIFCMSTALMMASCSNSGETAAVEDYSPIAISAGIGDDMQTRVSYDADGTTTKWVANTDCIGITGNKVYNVKYQASTSAATSSFTVSNVANDITIASTATSTFNAYYPFTGTSGKANTSAVTISADNNIDYMFASAAVANSNLTLQFAHKLAKLTIKVTDGTNEISGATWQITNGLYAGTFDTSTGTVTTDATSVLSMTNPYTTSSYLLLPAQTINQGTLTVKVGPATFTASLAGKNISLEAGKHTTITITAKYGLAILTISAPSGWGTEAGETTL